MVRSRKRALYGTLRLPENHTDVEFWRMAQQRQYVITRIGLLGFFLCLGMGVWLIVQGVGAETTWSMKFGQWEAEMNTGYPGVIVIMAGIAIAWITRWEIDGKPGKKGE